MIGLRLDGERRFAPLFPVLFLAGFRVFFMAAS